MNYDRQGNRMGSKNDRSKSNGPKSMDGHLSGLGSMNNAREGSKNGKERRDRHGGSRHH